MSDFRTKVRWLCYKAAVKHALKREKSIGTDERSTDWNDKASAAIFLFKVNYEWAGNRSCYVQRGLLDSSVRFGHGDQ